jgi:chaperonin GroEL (HSP60 family)
LRAGNVRENAGGGVNDIEKLKWKDKNLVEQGVSSQTIVKGLRRGSAMAVNKIKEIAVDVIGIGG